MINNNFNTPMQLPRNEIMCIPFFKVGLHSLVRLYTK